MKGKNLLAKEKAFYTRVPNKALDRTDISNNTKLLYVFLLKQREDFNPGQGFLADIMNCSKPSIRKFMKELEDRNMIHKYRQGGKGHFSLYEFVGTKDWK